MDPATRRVWHRNGLRAMAQVQQVDWRAIGFGYLDQSHHGALGTEQRRGYLDHYRQWVTQGDAHPVIDPAWEWLRANWPDDSEHVELCWGDARPGNLMYDGTTVIGVFDWEMVSLGNGESDLGWWCFLQRYHTDGTGVALPAGMLDRAETIAEWERLRSRSADHVDFYERLGGFQFCLVMVRLAEAMGIPEMGRDNPVATITRQLIDSA
jgi:aminoglycoside phosphotransferase (APT) family kinase protein